MIDPPLVVFIAAIPVLKMLSRPSASTPERFIGQVLDGAAKPVGGSSEATIELADTGNSASRQPKRSTMWQEARQIVERTQARQAPVS